MKKIGVCLSGCGVMDGSEIHEAVLTLLAIDRAGAKAICIAPNIDQAHVIDHASGKVMAGEKRNVMIESARIARGEVRDLKDVTVAQIDALIFPGGFGAAKNLCDFAMLGTDCRVHPDVDRLVTEMATAGKPIGAACIAPAMLARVFRDSRPVELTIGNDADVAGKLNRLGARHKDCKVDEVVIDRKNKVVTTPAYMLAQRISEAAAGIEKMVEAVVEMA